MGQRDAVARKQDLGRKCTYIVTKRQNCTVDSVYYYYYSVYYTPLGCWDMIGMEVGQLGSVPTSHHQPIYTFGRLTFAFKIFLFFIPIEICLQSIHNAR